MYALEAYEEGTGYCRGFVRLSPDHCYHRIVERCDKASHFFRASTAALIKARFERSDEDPLRVITCTCVAGVEIGERIQHFSPHPDTDETLKPR